MKVQLLGQTLRLRIDEAELVRLQAGETLENLTRLPGGQACRQRVQLHDAPTPGWAAAQAGGCFLLPCVHLQAYVATLPCRESLAFQLVTDDGDAIEIHFEVDVRDSVRNRGVRRR